MFESTIFEGEPKSLRIFRDSYDKIPSVDDAKRLVSACFPTRLIPRLGERATARIAEQFPNWSQGLPSIRVAQRDWPTLKHCLGRVGNELPLAVVSQVSYGQGMGHPRVGLFRYPKYDGEVAHTYLYHAAPGRSLRFGQACDYCRLDHVSRKPTLYCFWVLNNEIVQLASEELHRRWEFYRHRESDPHQFDCAKFVTDFARFVASVGQDPDNPFNYSIPSHTILAPCRSEDRGLYAILRNTHRPPAMLLFVQDEHTYARNSAFGHHDDEGYVIDSDSFEFNVTRQ